ncbi:Hypothetical protein A7982_00992 [Minicystis rosea]|nr:Hypothetical protein A7982_00992 [Minicystis rosea]
MDAAALPWCSGLYVTHLVRRAGTIFFISPESLVASTDGWGPQSLALSVEHDFDTGVTYERSPSLSKQKNDITKSLSATLGYSVTSAIDLTASTLVLVPTDAYYRLEAYPEYDVIDWELHADACGPQPDLLVTTGTVYRPIGIHFRVSVFVGGEWNALAPPSPAERLLAPPWTPGNVSTTDTKPENGATSADGGAPSTPADGGAP